MKNNKIKFGITAAIATVSVIVSILLVNAIVSVIADILPLKIDMSQNGIYKISEPSKQTVSKLDKDVTVYAMYKENATSEYTAYVKGYLEKYQKLNAHIKVSYVDPYNDPGIARKYTDKGAEISTGTVIVECGDIFRIIDLEDIYVNDTSGNATTIDFENQFTKALKYVTGTEREAYAYFVSGHGEDSTVGVQDELIKEGYTCMTLNVGLNGVPENTRLLIIMAPTKDYTPDEINYIDRYMQSEGQILCVLTPGTTVLDNFEGYLDEWGITLGHDYVIEEDSSHAYKTQSGTIIPAPIMQSHQITEKLAEQKMIFMAPSCESIATNDDNPQGAKSLALLSTTDKAWGKTDLKSESFKKTDADLDGPLNVATITSKNDSNIVTIGSLQAIELEGILKQSSYANGDFVLNCVSYMTDKSENLGIRAKVISSKTLMMSQNQITITSVILQYIIPLIILGIGFAVWLKRRYL